MKSTYDYMCVCLEADKPNPFMEEPLAEARELEFTFYPTAKNVTLTVENWKEILDRATAFLPHALKLKDDYRRLWGVDT